MNKPILVIMAAGLGSRYGGLKQIAPVDDAGHILLDYAMYDAWKAGFERMVFIVTEALEPDLRAHVEGGAAEVLELRYAHQRLDDLPPGFAVPEGRTKPWGTAHAVLSAKALIDAPFAVINADDYYGPQAFRLIHDFLTGQADASHHAMVGYRIENTLTEHGHVARGVCKVDGRDNLVEIVERTHIVARPDGAAFTEDGEHFTHLPEGTIVSMNMWGFGREMMDEIESHFGGFLRENLPVNPLKCEYFLPWVPNKLLEEGKAQIRMLPTADKWYGVTYADDMPRVRAALKQMQAEGRYAPPFWRT